MAASGASVAAQCKLLTRMTRLEFNIFGNSRENSMTENSCNHSANPRFMAGREMAARIETSMGSCAQRWEYASPSRQVHSERSVDSYPMLSMHFQMFNAK